MEGGQNTGQVRPQRVCLGVPLSLGPAPLLYSVAPSFLIVPVSWCHFLKVQTPPEKQSLHGVGVVVVFNCHGTRDRCPLSHFSFSIGKWAPTEFSRVAPDLTGVQACPPAGQSTIL